MEMLVSAVLRLDTFSEERMDAQIEKAVIKDGTVTFHFKDGHTECQSYEEKKRGVPHTEEYKQHMRQLMKERWTPEVKQQMSESMKNLRKERGKAWQKEK